MAIIKLLFRYYHNEKDIDDDDDDGGPQPAQANCENNNEIAGTDLPNKSIEPIIELDIPSSGLDETDVEISSRESSEEKSRSNVLAEINIEAKNNRNIEKIIAIAPSNSSTPSVSLTQSPSTETELEPKPGCSTELATATSNADEISTTTTATITHAITNMNTNTVTITNTNTNVTSKIRKNNIKLKTGFNTKYSVKSSISSIPKLNVSEASTSNIDGIKVNKLSLRPSSNQMSFTPTSLSGRDSCSDSSSRYSSSAFESARNEKKKDSTLNLKSNTGNNINNTNNKLNRKFSKNDGDALHASAPSGVSGQKSKRSSVPRKISHIPTSTNANINISSDFCKDPNQSNGDDQSNMFLYIDLHGHASKKGIFMYGNYLPKVAESVECMLLPRLMSMNSHHFHFDACVFSERNMYHKYEPLNI